MIITWERIIADSHILARVLASKGIEWQGIVAVARGGLVPAAIIANVLNIRMVDTLVIASYEGRQQSVPLVLKAPRNTSFGGNWLVVDDLVDTGCTMQVVARFLPNAVRAVLYAKPEGERFADVLVERFAQDVWLDFPWERSTNGVAHPGMDYIPGIV